MSQIVCTCDEWRLINHAYCLVRLARKVLDQEAVTDTFLKTLPAKTDHYQILYPVRISPNVLTSLGCWDHIPVRMAAMCYQYPRLFADNSDRQQR